MLESASLILAHLPIENQLTSLSCVRCRIADQAFDFKFGIGIRETTAIVLKKFD